jgi:membrane protease YdiL (CAAX protease family)
MDKLKSISIAILAMLLYIIGIEIISVWVLLARAIGFENYSNYYLLIQGSLQLMAVLIFIYFIRKQSFRSLIGKMDLKWYLFALILGTSFVFIQTPLNWLYNFLFDTEHAIAYNFDGLPKFKNINWISLIILIPIGEELFFRAYIQNKLQHKINSVVIILLVSVLFAAIHSPYVSLFLGSSNADWHRFYIAFFGGLISGILYHKSKSIVPSIIFHIFWNLAVTIV